MALETYFDSNSQLAVSPMAPTPVGEAFAQPSRSGIFFHKDGQFQAALASLLNLDLSFGSGPQPSFGASSLVTDANSALSGSPHLKRSASTNMESYLNLPSSPLSFSSNNLSISGSSVIDGSSIVQQLSHLDQNFQQVRKRQQRQRGSAVTSQSTSQKHHVSLLSGVKQEPSTSTQMHKKPRLDTGQEDILQQQIIEQLLQRQDSVQVPGYNQQLQALIQQHRLRNLQQQQILQSIPQLQGIHTQQQPQMRYPLQQQPMRQVSAVKHLYDGGVCARRLMQYIYHQRHRPPDNNIAYWKKFVAEYYAPCAKKRWCLSLYDNVGHHALGVFPQASMTNAFTRAHTPSLLLMHALTSIYIDAWQCDICGSKSGRGFEAIFEVLPRLSKIKFESGVIDELLFLDLPRECRFPSGLMMLEYGKAVQESVYEQLCVVHEGQLRIIFTHDLKILSWEFCARRHEELLPRRLVAPEVNQLVQAAQKYQSSINGSGSGGLSPLDLQENCNMFLTAGHQLARNLELKLVDDFGLSKRYVRCLQICEVVNSMKDLMTFSWDNNIGPIESLKNYARETTTTKLKTKEMQEKEQQESAQGPPIDGKRLMAMHPNLNSNANDNMSNSGLLTGSERAALALSSCYQKLPRQDSFNSNVSAVREEPSCPLNSSNQGTSSPFPGPKSSSPGLIQNLPVNGLSSSHSSQGSQNIQQRMIQKLLLEMIKNSGAKGVHSANGGEGEEVFCGFKGNKFGGLPTRARDPGIVGNELGFGNSTLAAAAPANVLGNAVGRIKSFKAASNSNPSGVCGNHSFIKREPDLPEKLHISEVVRDMAYEFYENGGRDDMGYGWKA